MEVYLSALGIVFGAFVVWLGVRVVNRRERWAKWMLAAVIGIPVLYFASFGPACWLCEKRVLGQRTAWIMYRPLIWLCRLSPDIVGKLLFRFAELCGDQRRVIKVRYHYQLWSLTTFGSGRAFVPGPDSVSPLDYEYTRHWRFLRNEVDPEVGEIWVDPRPFQTRH